MAQLALLLTTVSWGATFPAPRAVLERLPPLPFLFIRFLVGPLLVLAVLLVWRRRIGVDCELLVISAVASLFLFVAYVTQTIGLTYTTASNSAFLTALYVVLVPLFLRRLGLLVWVSAALATVGLWLLVDPTMGPALEINRGDLLTLVCAAAFAAHIACLESFVRRSDPIGLFAAQMIIMTVAMGVIVPLEPFQMQQLAPTWPLVIALIVTAGFATAAFGVQLWAQQRVPAQRVALIFALEPVFAAWLAWYFLGEELTMQSWVGSGLILLAVVVGALGPSAEEEAVPSLAPGLVPLKE